MNEELQQQLMEFVYGLLDEDEANALSERITSDPATARAYATVKLQCDLVGRAARVDAPTIAWLRPGESTLPDAELLNVPASTYRRIANWCISIAAGGLIFVVASAYWMSARLDSNPEASIAVAMSTPLNIVVTGPSKLHAEADSPFTVQVSNEKGTPVSTMLDYRVYDAEGNLRQYDSTDSDSDGVASFDVESSVAGDAARLEVTASRQSPQPMIRDLTSSSERYLTYLRTDRPLYKPGEKVFFRSVTLSQYALQSDRELSSSFEIVNSNDEPLTGASQIVMTEEGVGSGAFTLPDDTPDGEYTLLAKSPQQEFAEEWRKFQVRGYQAPRLLKKLELARDSYTFGDQVELSFSAVRVAGEPVAEVPLQIEATLDGLSLDAPEAKTDANGRSRFSLELPNSIDRGEASVRVTVQTDDLPAETITKEIPINLGKVNVEFYPEGGDLADGLPSRVYFFGRDPLGKPAHIEGRVVDSTGTDVAEVVTEHDGRGVFFFTPNANETYRLVVDRPGGVTKEISLPSASPEQMVTMAVEPGVIEADAPVDFVVHQRKPLKRLLAAAYCRGAMVAQQAIASNAHSTSDDSTATYQGQLVLPDTAQGVIRLTIFDATQSPAEPIAERLVYRRVNRKLLITLSPDAESFTPGQAVQLDLSVMDEQQDPVAAILGISIVDDAVLNLADDKSVRMPTYFHLLSELDSSAQLEDANFYLADDAESAAALDTLLGTQGWRRFISPPASQLAQGRGSGFGGGGFGQVFSDRHLGRLGDSLLRHELPAVPLATSMTIDARPAEFEQAVNSSRAGSHDFDTQFIVWLIAGLSAALLILVAGSSLRWVRSNLKLRIAAVVLALAAIGILILPMRPGREVSLNSNAVKDTAEAADAGSDSMPGNGSEQYSYGADKQDQSTMQSMPQLFEEERPASDAPVDSDATATTSELQPQTSPKAEARQMLRSRENVPNEPAAVLRFKKEKAATTPSPAAQPIPKNPAKSAPPVAEPEARMSRSLQDAAPAEAAESDATRQRKVREYAAWFFEPNSGADAADRTSSTVFWHPLFRSDESGKVTVFFTLPARASSFRAIVEAHGASRLGSAEMLFDSRQP